MRLYLKPLLNKEKIVGEEKVTNRGLSLVQQRMDKKQQCKVL